MLATPSPPPPRQQHAEGEEGERGGFVWIAAEVLAALTCGLSFGEEAEAETTNEKLFALCKDPKTTPEAIEAILKAGADIEARAESGVTPLFFAAAFNSNPEMIETLLNPHGLDSHRGVCCRYSETHRRRSYFAPVSTSRGVKKPCFSTSLRGGAFQRRTISLPRPEPFTFVSEPKLS